MTGYASPPKEHQFKKGQSGNPSGPGKHTISRKILKEYTQSEVAETFSRLLGLPKRELNKLTKEGYHPILENIIAKALLKDCLRGEMSNIEKILDRVIGKVPQTVKNELSGKEGTSLPPSIITFSAVNPAS